jgi:hypothetical protein
VRAIFDSRSSSSAPLYAAKPAGAPAASAPTVAAPFSAGSTAATCAACLPFT